MKGIRDLGFGIGCECGKPECLDCAEAAALVALMREEFEHTQQHARVPTPEIVWWRTQMRAREEAARRAARPILLSQALALAALIGLLVSVVGRLTLPAFALSRFGEAGSALTISWTTLTPIVIATACWIVLAPLALYLAFSRD
jgi:hypothetical protein